MASLPSSLSRFVLRTRLPSQSATAATRALSTSITHYKVPLPPTGAAPTTAVYDLPMEALNIASSSSSTTAASLPRIVKSLEPDSRRPGMTVTVRHVTRAGKARQLLNWTWLTDLQRSELLEALEASDASDENLPFWLESEIDSAKSFCEARSRLWIPSALPAGVEAESVQAWLTASTDALALKNASVDSQLDEVLKPVWRNMSAQARENALIECRFACLRKLGWRSGYSAGYPVQEAELTDERKDLLAQCKLGGTQGAQGLFALQSLDDELAWDSWLAMSPAQRTKEELEAWAVRDRSSIYTNDSPSSQIIGRTYTRWLESPQRSGQLIFLPNFIIRLVRNYTPRGTAYDPWKATFRVPLNLHKHGLRSFLLSVYGLRTTWIRSMIYRAPIRRGGRDGRSKVTGSVGTWKKIEVGLLEPFVYPTMGERYRKDVLLEDEMNRENVRRQMRLNGVKRLRGGRPVQNSFAPEHLQKNHFPEMTKPLSLEEEEAKLVPDVGAAPLSTARGVPSRGKGLFNLTTRSGLHPTRRNKNILKVLNGLRKERMRLVEEGAEGLKASFAPAAKN